MAGMPLSLPQIADLLRPITQAQEKARKTDDDEPTPETEPVKEKTDEKKV